jgi:hypothetical protein
MNTKLTYLYRDGSNYKQWDEIESVEPTEQAPTIDTPATETLQRFKTASDRGWEKCLTDLIAGRL